MAVKRKLDGVQTLVPQEQEAEAHAESPEQEPQEEQVEEKRRKQNPLNETFVVVPPKVIGQFRVPFPLSHIATQKIELITRLASDPFGMGSAVGGGKMVMTAEKGESAVSTAGLWLIVREGFGGLSGKKCKGDG